MKCTQCNSTHLVKTNLKNLFYVSGDARLLASSTLEVYVCEECGHVEFFDSSFLSKNKEEEKINDYYNKLINQLKQEKEEKFNCKIRELEIELGKANIKLNDLDITVRQQSEIKNRVSEINKELIAIDREIEKNNTLIKKYESERQQKISKLKANTRSFHDVW